MRPAKLPIARLRNTIAPGIQHTYGWLRETSSGRTVWRVLERLIGIQLIDRALGLAAKGFISLLPVIIAGSIFTSWKSAAHALDDQLGFEPSAVSAGHAGVIPTPTFAAFGVAGLILVLLGGTSFARALGRVYRAIWDVPAIGARDSWRWLVALLTVAVSVGTAGAVRGLVSIPYAGRPLALAGEFVVWTLVWTLVPYLLTKGAVPVRVLWACGVLTGAGLTAVRAGGRVVLPGIAANARRQFGPLGLGFTTVSWFVALSMVIVGAATIVAALAQDEAALGRFLRGPGDGNAADADDHR
ncbi:membrane protein [Nocardia transvalensis]|uniref:Membrane protein n=1 Tax=Nocardia transvalensis TaxID=37333 RepID=A0A7W9P9J4_9NOCA|nr:membrane protein [Nocardia transvalensis]MBB5912022.1 membrane protein [Nocardia transvalensis]